MGCLDIDYDDRSDDPLGPLPLGRTPRRRPDRAARRIGGTQANRAYDQLIFIPVTARNDNARHRSNDIGWTLADNSGNTGYGCRCYGEANNLKFIGNKVHDIAADGFQGSAAPTS